MILVCDQASNSAGCSLWTPGGTLIAVKHLFYPVKTDPYSRRLKGLVAQLEEWLQTQPKITQVVFEQTKPRLVTVSIGAFLTAPSLDVKLHETASFVSPSTWKKWAQQRGATGKFSEIKGCKALRETGFDLKKWNITSCDVADSILIGRSWFDRR